MRKLLVIILFTLAFTYTSKKYSKAFYNYGAYKNLKYFNGYVKVHVIRKGEIITHTNVYIYHATIKPIDGGPWRIRKDVEFFWLWQTTCKATIREKPTRKSKALTWLRPGVDVAISTESVLEHVGAAFFK